MKADSTISPEQQLDRLWSVHEIRQLAYRYAHAFAVRDRDLMLSLWAESDPPAQLPAIDGHRLRADVDRWFAALGTVLLHVTNHVIEFDGDDAATGEVHCLGQIDLGHRFVDQTILYRDRYLRTRVGLAVCHSLASALVRSGARSPSAASGAGPLAPPAGRAGRSRRRAWAGP